MTSIVNIYDAKTQLSALVDRACGGEEIIIAKNGVPKAKLVSIPNSIGPRTPAGALGLTHIAEDFDAPDEAIEALFDGRG
jgi:prevent-host-death family protein